MIITGGFGDTTIAKIHSMKAMDKILTKKRSIPLVSETPAILPSKPKNHKTNSNNLTPRISLSNSIFGVIT